VLAVHLHLRLARAAGADAAAEARHGLAPAAETRQQVVELGQLDLDLPLPTARVEREDVEDQGRAINDLHSQALLDLAQLPGGQLLIEGDQPGPPRMDEGVQLVELAATEEGGRIGVAANLDEAPDLLRACRVGQGCQLVEGALVTVRRDPREDRRLADRGTPGGRQR
jgi:hypothetical protein